MVVCCLVGGVLLLGGDLGVGDLLLGGVLSMVLS